MTIYELTTIFDTAVARSKATNREDLPDEAHRRAGLVAVVEAMRDEFGRIIDPGDDWNRQGIMDQFNDILGGAGEKAAGAPTSNDGADAKASLSSPAADPVGAVKLLGIIEQCTTPDAKRSMTDLVAAVKEWNDAHEEPLDDRLGPPAADHFVDVTNMVPTDPSPEVCKRPHVLLASENFRICSSCGMPILFKEARP